MTSAATVKHTHSQFHRDSSGSKCEHLISYVRVWHPRPLFWSPVWFCLLCLYIWWLDVSRMVFFSCWWRWLWWTTLVQPFRKWPLDPAEDSECDLSVLVLFYSQFCDVLSPVWAPLTFGTGKMILHCQVVVGSLWRLVDVTDCFLFFFCFLARCLAPLQPGNEPVYGVKILGWYSVLEERKKGQEN